MSSTRIRLGEILAGAGAAGLIVVLFLDWFGLEDRTGVVVPAAAKEVAQSGWNGLGWLALVFVVIAVVAALAIVAAAVSRQPPAWAVGSAVVTAFFGIFAFCAVVISLLIQPDLGFGLPNQLVTVKGPAYAGLALVALIAVGGWITMADERTDAPYSAPPELEPRPIPPPAEPAAPAG